MILAKRSVEMLLDLVETKINYMDVLDLQDLRDLQALQQCREELKDTIDAGASYEGLVLQADVARSVH